MRFKKRSEVIEALRLSQEIRLGDGSKGVIGDWLVQYENGTLEILPDKTFSNNYEKL